MLPSYLIGSLQASMDPSSSIRCVGEELTVQWDERDALRPLKYKVELVKVRTGYVRVVGMQGGRLFPGGSSGVCRKGRFDMCK